MQRSSHILFEQRYHPWPVPEPGDYNRHLFNQNQYTITIIGFLAILTVVHMPLVIPPHVASLAQGSQITEPVISSVMV